VKEQWSQPAPRLNSNSRTSRAETPLRRISYRGGE
jgi:hypothetical protein